METNNFFEIIWFGRGGQGAVTGSQIFATAAIMGGYFKDCTCNPSFGAERRGAPIEAYTRVSDTTIWTRSHIYTADIIVVLDETVFGQNIVDKLKPKYRLVINTNKKPQEIYNAYNFGKRKGQIATADLIKICFDVGLLVDGQPVLNTPILGSVTRVLEQIKLDDIIAGIEDNFGKGPKSDKNIQAAKMAAEITCVNNF
jgi:pyruvate ferredoxin oxidoreductase gamma subunit